MSIGISTSALSAAPIATATGPGWSGNVIAAARGDDPVARGAALRRIDEYTGSMAATEALLADPERRFLKMTNAEADQVLFTSANYLVHVGDDFDGDPVFRFIDDADIWGTVVNNSGHSNMGPLASVSWVEENNRFIAQMQSYNAQERARDGAERAQLTAIAATAAGVGARLDGLPDPVGSSAWTALGTNPIVPVDRALAGPVDEPEIVVTASSAPLSSWQQQAGAMRVEALDAGALALDAQGLPVLETLPATNPGDLLAISVMESRYDAYWRAANADGLHYDPAEDARVRAGFAEWRAETVTANVAAQAGQLETLRMVLPPLDLALSAGAVAGGDAGVWDYVTVGTAALPMAGSVVGRVVAAERALNTGVVAAEGAIPTIGGRLPINSRYAGQVHPSGVAFNERGFPNFRPHSEAEVEIPSLTGKYGIDSRLANQAMGYPSTPKGYVWHHVEDGATMQLIPKEVHNSVRHTAGAAVIRNGGYD